jgi:SsrA-binding protein
VSKPASKPTSASPPGDRAKKKSGGKSDEPQLTAENRRARFDYTILDTLECGIVLRGSEVKSLRAGKVSIAEGFVRPEKGGLLLFGMNIDEYGPAGPLGGAGQHKAKRPRTLLAHKREIAKLARQVEEKGMTIVPLKLYFKNGFAKVLVGLAKGRAKHDKRDAIGKREAQRDIQRAMSRKLR